MGSMSPPPSSSGGSSLPSGSDGDILVHSGGSWQGTQTADLLANSLQCEQAVTGGSVAAGALTATDGSNTAQVAAESITMNSVEITRDHMAGVEAANPSAASPVALLSQAVIILDTQANRPASAVSGQEFSPTNGCGPVRQIYGASSWGTYYLGLQCTQPPAAASLSQIHFALSDGTASVADVGPCLVMQQTGNNSTSLRDYSAAVQAIPASGAYTFDVGMDIAQIREGYCMCGICVVDGVGPTPKMIDFVMSQGNYNAAIPSVFIGLETNPTTNSSSTGGYVPLIGGGGRIFLRYYDDRTTNHSFWMSFDGYHWVRWFEGSRAAFLTPAYIGIAIGQQGTAQGGAIATTRTRSILKVFHWKVAAA